MCGPTIPYTIAASANVGPANGGVLRGVSITGGADAASVIMKQNGSSGETLLKLCAGINTTAPHWRGELVYSGQLYALITGTTPTVLVEL